MATLAEFSIQEETHFHHLQQLSDMKKESKREKGATLSLSFIMCARFFSGHCWIQELWARST